ncbi:hypothetical protein [Nannocystis pusilla]|uniref:hypothetical protein n=1 Tax=Nannocystis pusilla TaxID=889268 RepID=UPI003B7828F9
MLSYWMDFNDPLRTFDSLRRRMDQALREYADSEGRGQNLAFPAPPCATPRMRSSWSPRCRASPTPSCSCRPLRTA